ncbi:MAG: TolC family protein, partial [Deltaproteobacteria bacterium]
DVETALLNIASNLERVRSSETAIEQGKESLRIEQEKYALGRGSITDVLDAQAALLTSQTNYYRSLSEYNTSIAELHLAIGEEE